MGLDLATGESNSGAEQAAATEVADVESTVASEGPVLLSDVLFDLVCPEEPMVPKAQTVPITSHEEPLAIPFDELIVLVGWSETVLEQNGANNGTPVFQWLATSLAKAGAATSAFARKYFRKNEI